MKIENKVIVVTGGASGLGLALVQGLLKENAKIVVLDIDKNKLDLLPKTVYRFCINITDYDLVQKTIDEIIEKIGFIDVLINNAGVIFSEPLINLFNQSNIKHSYECFKKNIHINLNSVFIMTSIVVEKMILNRTQGVIINMSSISANGNSGQTAYSAAKAGVEAMTKTWAKELGAFGIRVAAIAPGFINTESTKQALSEKNIKHIVDNTPLKKLGEPENIFQTVKFIIDNEFVTGTIININGGLTI